MICEIPLEEDPSVAAATHENRCSFSLYLAKPAKHVPIRRKRSVSFHFSRPANRQTRLKMKLRFDSTNISPALVCTLYDFRGAPALISNSKHYPVFPLKQNSPNGLVPTSIAFSNDASKAFASEQNKNLLKA